MKVFRSIVRIFLVNFLILLQSTQFIASSFPHKPGNAAGKKDNVYEDIYLIEGAGKLVFGNNNLRLEIDRSSGIWNNLTAENVPGKIVTADTHSIDFVIDGVEMISKHKAKLMGYRTVIDRMRKNVSLEVVLGVLPVNEPSQINFEYELSCLYTLMPGKSSLERTVTLTRNAKARTDSVHLEGFIFKVENAVISNPAACVVDVPGPFFPDTYVAPGTPYATLINRHIKFHSAPDAGFGILAIGNPAVKKTLASWMNTGGEVNYSSSIAGNGQLIAFKHHDLRSYYLPQNTAVGSDTHTLFLADGALRDALSGYRKMVSVTMPVNTAAAKWVKEMVLLEVYPKYFKNGIKGLTEKLPFYKKTGFNTIYLMPHWVGGYSPLDLYSVEPSLGTEQDLKDMVKTAHSLGMKVLFDMVIHGFNEKSMVVEQKPELFVRNEKGNLALHPTWKSVSTDWASPKYQQYMADLVLHDVETYNIDGYRVDAASYKGPGWDKMVPYPAYRSGTAAPELMKKMLSAMQTVNPEAVLLSEVFGPVFYTVSNLVHDNQTEAPQLLLEKLDKGEINIHHYKAHIANVLQALPEGVNRVFFTRNHDTSWFYHFNGYTRRFMAMEAVHALFGIPEVFAGDPDNGPHPDTDPDVYKDYGSLFKLKAKLPELTQGSVLLNEIQTDNPLVFSGLRKINGHLTLVLISFSDKTEQVKLNFDPALKIAGLNDLMIFDAFAGKSIKTKVTGNIITLQPYQVVAGRLPK